MKDSFVFYRSFYEAVCDLKVNDKAKLIDAICELGLNGKEIELSGVVKTIFKLIKPQILANSERYTNGLSGGRPQKYDYDEINKLISQGLNNYEIAKVIGCSVSLVKNIRQKGQKPDNNLDNNLDNNWTISQKPNVNVNDNVNVNENDNVNANVNENVNMFAPSSFKETDSELFIELPLIDKTHFPIYSKDLEKWNDIYPAVNIEQEFRNMFGWLNSNPKNRKTKTGISRFINNWLSRSQDRARTVSSSVPTKSNDVASNSTPLKTYSENTDIETMDDEEFLAYINGGGR